VKLKHMCVDNLMGRENVFHYAYATRVSEMLNESRLQGLFHVLQITSIKNSIKTFRLIYINEDLKVISNFSCTEFCIDSFCWRNDSDFELNTMFNLFSNCKIN
jgi:hypothetical protein